MEISTTNPFTVLDSLPPESCFPSAPSQAGEGRKKIKRRTLGVKELAGEALAATQVEGRKRVKRKVHEAKALAVAVAENPFLGSAELFGVVERRMGRKMGEER